MTVRLYDTRSQALRELEPVVPGRVGMYVCGPTVQSSPHVGHLRSALSYDVLRRWLTHRGLAVTLIRNVTDVDDKILDAAPRAGSEWWAHAFRVEQEFAAAYRALGVQEPTYEPRATGHIGDMISLIERLIETGHAYPAPDDSGDVWFDVASWPDYGLLTRQTGDALVSGEDGRARRSPRDFALWKGHKPEEPASAAWASPWGSGRPGWHIECSAMAQRYLGAEFDIHGGGLDLRFPHHENELAQSTASGSPFARLWVHNGLVTVAGQKMSKSLGNSVFAADLLGSARPVVVRYALVSAHYRSDLDLHDGALLEAEEALSRVERFVARAVESGATPAPAIVPDAFAAAMDDDLGVPQALAVLHETIRRGNQAIDSGALDDAGAALAGVRAMTGVLGIDPSDPAWSTGVHDDGSRDALGALVERLIAERQAAREARDFATADRVRDELAAAGIALTDTGDGTRWSIDGR
ncbi:cysteine--tRNA ligase [Amnibacterium soli]|uniref:Cysteine--tRNA ligase n=1 Tax=Amnibacterium soli TaxID=1282736 RepID=A0ABP8ZAJ0_9MICO